MNEYVFDPLNPQPYISTMTFPDDGMLYATVLEGEEEDDKPSLIKPLGAALAGALLGGWITDSFPLPNDDQTTKIQKSQKLTAAFLASGFVGLVIGMIGR